MRPTNTLPLALLLAVAGCASPMADDDTLDDSGDIADRPAGDPADVPPSTADLAPSGECVCDVTALCDEDSEGEPCFCDIACSAPDVPAPIGEHFTMLGRAETLLLSSSMASTPLSRVEAFDDTWVPTTLEQARDGRPGLPFGPMAETAWERPALTSLSALGAYSGRPEAFAADIDDDGREEALVADGVGLYVLRSDGGELTRSLVFPAPSAQRRVSAGDLDGDGIDEAVLSTAAAGGVTITVLDLDGGRASVAATLSLGAGATSVATGDVDGDREVELVVAQYVDAPNSAHLVVTTFGLIDGVLVEEASEHVLTCNADARLLVFGVRDVPMADLSVTTHDFGLDTEGDSIALAYRCNEEMGVQQLHTFGDEIGAYAAWEQAIAGDDVAGFDRLQLSGAHPEIAAVTYTDSEPAKHRIYVAYTKLGDRDGTFINPLRAPEARLIEVDPARRSFYEIDLDAGWSAMPSLTVSDSDLDGQADLQVAYNTLQSCGFVFEGCIGDGLSAMTPAELHIVRVARGPYFSIDYASYFSIDGYTVESRMERRLDPSPRNNPWITVDRYWGAPLIIGADLDGDSVRLRATGEVLKHQMNPRIQALLAAAPTWTGRDGIEQEGGTTLGNASCSGTGAGEANSMSASATVTVGADILGIVDVSSSTTLGYEYTTENESERTVCLAAERTSDADDDMVVFFVTPVASHVYEVVAHPNADEIGQEWTIDVPGEPVDTTLELTRFRQRYGDLADELIPPDLFTHIVGDPASYPMAHSGATTGDCNAMALNERVAGMGRIEHPYRTERLMMVGSTEDSLMVSIAEQTTTSTTETFSAEQSFSAEFVGNGGEVSFGLSGSSTSSIILGSEVELSGSVSPIVGSDAPEDRYEWGLCVYNYIATDGAAAYPVIDYVVKMQR